MLTFLSLQELFPELSEVPGGLRGDKGVIVPAAHWQDAAFFLNDNFLFQRGYPVQIDQDAPMTLKKCPS